MLTDTFCTLSKICGPLLAVGIISMSSPASAVACGPSKDIVEQLTGRYSEQVIFQGLVNEREVVSIYLNEDTGSWTALVSRSDGNSCAVSAGEQGVLILPTEKPDGDPS